MVVPAGDNSPFTKPGNTPSFHQSDTVFWFAPGIHTLGDDQYSQIIPGDGSTYLGGPGAILDGRNISRFAFTQRARDVTIQHLTIRGFGTGRDNNDEGVVNHDRGDGWTVSNNSIVNNDGAGLMLGPNSESRLNCLRSNGQYGFSAVPPSGEETMSGLTFDRNEVSGNNTDDWEKLREGCGCTGGGKVWAVSGAKITRNYFHHNIGPGLWADYNNTELLVAGNWFARNDREAIIYEISYNFMIRHNVFEGNGVVAGKKSRNSPFPIPAIYISESGGDARAGERFAVSRVRGNLFQDNWDGVALWENADRFCRPGEIGDTTNTCPWFDVEWGARYRTQNIRVSKNIFIFSPDRVGCTTEHCGRNSLFSNWGSYPPDSPYLGPVVQQSITFEQNNTWASNRYLGPWRFQPWDMGTSKSYAQWTSSPYGQDGGSTYRP